MMAATRKEIREWFLEGKKKKATHLIVVCDSFSYEDYPVFVSKEEDVHKVFEEYNDKDMQKVMEVYNLSLGLEEQMKEHRAFNF